MIEVNLLPRGAGAAPRGRSGPSALTRALAGVTGRLGAVGRDPYLVGGVATALVAVALVGWLYADTRAEAEALAEREASALADSTRYAAAIAARRKATSERDSVERQLAVIGAIDSSRYVWAHVLDEVSRSMPPYTWLTSVQQTSAPPEPPGLAKSDSAAAKPGATPAAGSGTRTVRADSTVAEPGTVRFRIVGQTVDIQALTLFMRELEASPFLQRVQLARSEAVLADGKEVTEFTLDGAYRTAPRDLLRTETLVVPVAPLR
jgi:Tfp pilus assembly protein PilN